MRLATLSFFLFVAWTGAWAQSSSDYALMAKQAWAAFECSSLASVSDDTKEQERLFAYGFAQGKRFLAALRDKKIQQSDLSNIAPMGFLMAAQGPSPDFIMGRVFENAQENALKNVFAEDGKLHSKQQQKVIAEGRYNRANCRLLGLTK
jgi:hypothetical protein